MKWIKCSDEMPEKSVNVLIANIYTIGHAKLNSTGFTVIASNDFVPKNQVTHWMPLPELPEVV